MMTINTLEKKQEFRHDVELGLNNLKRCISFVAIFEDDKANYELEECSKEFLILNELKEELDYFIDSCESIEVSGVDYDLVRRWRAFNFETYKKHFFNRGSYQWYHG